MEQVGSITSSSKTTCNGSNRRLAGFISNKGASNEANARGADKSFNAFKVLSVFHY
ncbi:hypothetical protein [Clostridium botulinum]|uniref:Uncharacterized protein n=1 Tax=Clostridium botulinum (strain Kyoto / Type A2) TaxID=536232 RepID=C1FN08_CLOBJ|nr:hypothetical protein CLB_1557 [Clostridium botulinum A str. ATCC 19397]ACO86654.1 conserved hypothetical protein [Clostridium botulinum A2 str. Kyoto]